MVEIEEAGCIVVAELTVTLAVSTKANNFVTLGRIKG